MEEKIALYMKNLGLTREEAIALIADDENDVSVELTAEQQKNVKSMTQADHKPHGNHRKPDADKRFLIDFLYNHLEEIVNAEVMNPEREIQFQFSGALYKLTLSKPRAK